MKTRRGFLAALLCLPALRWVRPARMAPVTIAETLALPDPGNYDELLDVARFDRRIQEINHASRTITLGEPECFTGNS